MVYPPRAQTSIELVQNIRFAVDKNLLLEERIYTAESALELFGGSEMRITKRLDNFDGYIDGYQSPNNPNPPLHPLPAAALRIDKGKDPDGSLHAFITARFAPGNEVTYEKVRELFGFDSKPVLEIPGPHKIPVRPTASHGGEKFRYTLPDRKTVTIELHPDATLYWLSYEQKLDIGRVASLSALPPDVRNALQSLCGGCAFADSGESWNSTDVWIGNRPRRRFVSVERLTTGWRIEYEHGGRGYHTHIVTFSDTPSVHVISTNSCMPSEKCLEW